MDILNRWQKLLILPLLVFSTSGCTTTENIELNNNLPPKYRGVSTIRIENYVQRLFIDLIGREATDNERTAFTLDLKKAELHDSCRIRLVNLLLFDTTYRVGDSSYRHAFAQRIYNLSKARFLEGASDQDILRYISDYNFAISVSRLNGDSIGVNYLKEKRKLYTDILNTRFNFKKGVINYNKMCVKMLNNPIYDLINMNSFNFINAIFDDLFARKPTRNEFEKSFQIIEYNIPSVIFFNWASNKGEFCDILVNSDAFYEAQIRWFYYTLLQRNASEGEVHKLFASYFFNQSIEDVINSIVITDEYAQF